MFKKLIQKFQTREGFMFAASIALVFAMFALLAVGVHAFSKVDTDNSSATPATITVSGTGKASATPDIAQFSFTISHDAKTMSDAETAVSAQANALVTQLKAAGIADKDIQTTDFSAYPKYENQAVATPAIICASNNCPPPVTNQVIAGYTASTTYSVKVRDLTKADSISAMITAANVSSVSGPNFTIDNPDLVQNSARQVAITNAKTQAQVLAKELGVHLVRITDFQENDGGAPVPMYATAMKSDAAAAPAPDLESGETTVNANVTITYQIR